MRVDVDASPARAPLWTAAIGALSSAALVLHATGRVRSPLLLRALFAGWVMAPFALLAFGLALSPRWRSDVRVTLGRVVAVLAAVSVAGYGLEALASTRPHAPMFVLMPPVTVVVAAIAVIVAARRSRPR